MREDVTGEYIEIIVTDMRKLLAADESTLARTLNRILTTDKDNAYSSFNASI